MDDTLDLLEQRVALVTERLAHFKGEVARLERELLAPRPAAPAPAGDERGIAEEHARFLAERAAIRERVRALIAEIDRAL